jgi:hypothetical protein
MRFSTNLRNLKSKTFEPIPPGKYEAEIVDATSEESANHKRFLKLDFVIVGPAYQGRHLWTKLFMTDAAVWKLAALFNAIDQALSEEADTADLVGRRLSVAVKVIEGEDGVLRNEIVAFRKLKLAGTDTEREAANL